MSKLWYKHWANRWEEALPVGNGRMGAMIYGGPFCDKFSLNEETLWSGSPIKQEIVYDMKQIENIRKDIDNRQYDIADEKISDMLIGETCQAYLAFGSVLIEMLNHYSGDIADYYRDLDLETAISTTSCKLYDINVKEYIKHKRECFSSFADNVTVIHCSSSYNYLAATVHMDMKMNCSVTYENDLITIDGRCPVKVEDEHRITETDGNTESIPYRAKIKIISDGASKHFGSSVLLTGCSYFYLVISISTGFNGFDKQPISEGADYKKECDEKLNNALDFSYKQLKQRHVDVYRKIYNKSELHIDGENFDNIPTDERIKNVSNGIADNNLTELLFNYGKYLLISSSWGCKEPANLQGIWTNELVSTWNSNYTTNINTQMNYWMTEQVNLPECHMPLLRMIKDMSKIKNHYGLNGWLCCHNSDIWRFNREATKGVYAFWQLGGLWLCRHIYEHYSHTRDKGFLKEYMPVLKGSFDFLKEWLVCDKDNYLTTSPSTSPENYFEYNGKPVASASGSMMDLGIIRDFLQNIIICSEELGENTDEYSDMLNRIKPFGIGSDGRMLEWCEEFTEIEKGHRHLSFLFGIYPGRSIEENSDLYNAAKKSLLFRLENGGGHTGWSNAWVAVIFARFKDGENANKYIKQMFSNSIYPNMFDSHPPFQIDGNFGICAAISEMLLQSHNGKVKLLPACPKEWKSGYIKGFKARGGYTVDMEWKDGRVISCKITDINGKDTKLNDTVCI